MHLSDASFLRDIVERLDDVYWLCSVDGAYMYYVSPSYERVFGRTCASLMAAPRDWLRCVHRDDLTRMRAFVETASSEERRITYRLVRPTGEVRTIELRAIPVRDEAGAERIAGVARDITEATQLQSQVVETQRLESLAMLAGGVAHDFNNILAVVAANASMLEGTSVVGSEDHELVGEITTAVRRGTLLTRQLLAFSRKQIIDPVVTNLNVAISDALKMLRRVVGEDIVLVTSLEPELAPIKIDPTNLVQVLMNLVVNARDAMPAGGTLAIETRNHPASRSVQLSVRDTGTGMTADVLRHALEPLFTTKPPGKGTGLGLSVVNGIVKQAGGTLTIESAVGVGTVVSIDVPATSEPVMVSRAPETCDGRGSETVVLVDDDCYVRRSVARGLRGAGYQVLEAPDGATALDLLKQHGSGVALLVTDVVMPVMDGRELVEAARARRPSLAAIYMSGYIDDAVMRHGIKESEVPLLEKPFPASSLAERVRRVIDARR